MTQETYRRIRPSFWRDARIRELGLSMEEKALLLYLFTGPHSTMSGLYYCPTLFISSETGLDADEIEKTIRDRFSDFVSIDTETKEILVHEAARNEIGSTLSKNDNRVKRLRRELADAQSSELRAKFASLYPDWPHGLDEQAASSRTPDDSLDRSPPPLGSPSKAPPQAPSKDLVQSSSKQPSEQRSEPRQTKTENSTSSAPSLRSGASSIGASPDPSKPVSEIRQQEWNWFVGRIKPLIREYLWKGERPPPDAPPEWCMERELSVLRRWLKQGYSTEDLIGAISLRDGPPCTTAALEKKGNRADLNRLVSEHHKSLDTPTPIRELLRQNGVHPPAGSGRTSK